MRGVWIAGAVVALGGTVASEAVAQESALKTVRVQVDGRKPGNRATDEGRAALAGLSTFDLVCLNVDVVMDGSQRNAALASTENDTQRYPVACRADRMGAFPMGPGVEYYLPQLGKQNNQSLSLLVYPGSRGEQPFNTVDCVADPNNGRVARFRIRGFFTVDSKNLGSERLLELRPATYDKEPAITRQAAAECLK